MDVVAKDGIGRKCPDDIARSIAMCCDVSATYACLPPLPVNTQYTHKLTNNCEILSFWFFSVPEICDLDVRLINEMQMKSLKRR